MKERITPKDDIEIYNAVTNENTDKTQVLKWALCGKDYEDLEEQGLIVRLPCKVGDKVYHISGKNITEETAVKVDYDIHNGEIDLCNSFIYTNDIYDKEYNFYRLGKFGKSVFLAREEAEKRLKEIGK